MLPLCVAGYLHSLSETQRGNPLSLNDENELINNKHFKRLALNWPLSIENKLTFTDSFVEKTKRPASQSL